MFNTLYARLSTLLLILLFSSTAFAGGNKTEVCHFPPGDIENFHTININDKAVDAHLNHGDMLGECEEGPVDPEPGDACPCFTEEVLAEFGTPLCLGEEETSPETFAFYEGVTACSGDGTILGCVDVATQIAPGCDLSYEDGSLGVTIDDITPEEDMACRTFIAATCPLP